MALIGTSPVRAADCEQLVGHLMVGEALVAAQFVALAEKGGMKSGEINAILKNVAEKSGVQESGSPIPKVTPI